jgi:hypothetical protein
MPRRIAEFSLLHGIYIDFVRIAGTCVALSQESMSWPLGHFIAVCKLWALSLRYFKHFFIFSQLCRNVLGTECDNDVEIILKLYLKEQDIGLTYIFGQGAKRVILKCITSIVHIRPRVRNLYCAIDPLEVLIKPNVPSSEKCIYS